MYKDSRQLSRQLDRIAEAYDQSSAIHQKMAYRMLTHMQQGAINADQILEIGCRTGYMTQLLLDHLQPSTITTIGLSKRMMEIAHEKMTDVERVRWIQCDLDRVGMRLKPDQYDLLVSNALIHWLHFPEQTLDKWLNLLRPGGYLVASTFGPDTFQELRFLFQHVEQELGLPQVEHLFSFRDAESWKRCLENVGWERVVTMEYWIRQEATSCEEILRTLKAIGENYNCTDQNFYTSYRVLSRVLAQYDDSFRFREGVYTTLQMILLIGHKPRNVLSTSATE